MSIVGPEAVKYDHLKAMGIPTLKAMAFGQIPSMGHSWEILAALKELMDVEKGKGAQVPQGTVKDQVLAQAAPPMQAGIGAMQPPMGAQPPVRGFAEGGPVGTAAVNAQLADYFRKMFGPGWDRFKEETRRGLSQRRRVAGEPDDIGEIPKGTEATKSSGDPYARVGTEKGRATNNNPNYSNEPIERREAPIAAEITAPPVARGIGSTGVNPVNKYGRLGEYEKTGELAKPDQYKLDIPKNAQLGEAAERYKTPDPVRIKELREAEEGAGLAAFGRGMLGTKNGTGFGAVFGSAAADYVDAKEAKAEKRREYEDQREALATQLGIQVGKEAKDDYLANSKWGAERADAANQQAIRVLQAQNEATRFGNAEILDREKMAMTERIAAQSAAVQREANALQAEIRKDGVDQRKFERLMALQQGATKVAQDAADAWVKANPAAMAGGPDIERRIADIKRTEYRKLFPPALEVLMHQGLGIGGAAQPTQADPRKVVRGRL